MADVWTSAGVVVGVALVFATGWLRLDPLVALAVAYMSSGQVLALVRRSASGLLDAAISHAGPGGT
jgi:divalent metal cation (Fe/Co/Zn/Cd) transporter